ncbi:MAG: tetratricopeptide repeat protein, partial [Rhodospirillales bacterium]|nr:tetratricopeptide repeat protein [Rhodospirillales bacterium]
MNKMTSSAVQKADYFLAKGFSAHQTGNFEKAEKIYRRILKTHPNHGDALHFLGLLAHQNGKNEAALKLITKATQAKPEDVSIYTNLAIVYNALMQWQQAEGACRAALEIQADHSEASNNLGRALAGQGKFDGAENAYCHAVRSDRKNAAAYNNLG